jgi:hypothetical protein
MFLFLVGCCIGWLGGNVLGVGGVGVFRWDKNQEKPVKFACKNVQYQLLYHSPFPHSKFPGISQKTISSENYYNKQKLNGNYFQCFAFSSNFFYIQKWGNDPNQRERWTNLWALKQINEIHLTGHQDFLNLNGKWEALKMGRFNESLKKGNLCFEQLRFAVSSQ